jgi:Putative amidase domain
MRAGVSRRIRAAGLLAAVLGAFVVGPGNTLAYSASSAITYADNHANPGSENCILSPCLPNDCAAFVSQVLSFGGGYAQTTPKTTNTHDLHFWWEKPVGGGFGFTDSWGGADANYRFQILHFPGGTLRGTVSGLSTVTASGISHGSLLYYDWDGNGVKDHVAIQVGHGTDPSSGWFGDYVDQHSTSGNHFRHGFWSARPYNPSPSTTTIYLVAISSSN